MFRLLKCLGCQSNSTTVAPETKINEQFEIGEDNFDLQFRRKFSQSIYPSSQTNITSNSSTYMKSSRPEENIAMRFLETIQNKTVQERKEQESNFVTTHCFAEEPKYLIQNLWSIQYTLYLQSDTTNSLRKIDNQNLIENGRLKSELKSGKDYFVVSKTVWILIKHLYGGGPEIERDKMLPRKELTVFGLQNNLYSCYFNAGFQALLSIPEFVDYFFHGQQKHSTKYPSKTLSTLINATLKHLATAVPSDSFELGSLKKYIELKFSPDTQHDCQQFIRYFISRLQEELNPKHHQTQIKSSSTQQTIERYEKSHISIFDILFSGEIVSEIKCTKCDLLSCVTEPIMEITLQMKNESLEDSLDHHFSPQKLVDLYSCERCMKQTRATRQFRLIKPPMYLMITIKRFMQDRTKNHEDLQYEEIIDLSYYSKQPLAKGYKYQLQSVIIHSGSVNKGHYYLLTKRNRKWYEINDRRVKRINIEEYLETQAYVLIYERKD